jgi:hypothetical protein
VGVSAPAATLIRGNPQVPASVVTVSAPDAGTVGGSLLSTSCAVTVTAPTALSLAPTVSNRTGWWKAATTVELWKEVAQTNHPANGEIVAAWDDVVDATAFRLGIKGGAGTEPLYVADGIKAGLGSVEFDGFNDYLHTIADASTTDAAMSNFFAAGAKSMYLAIWLTGNGSNDATVYNNNGIVIDVGTYFGLLAKTVTGVTALHAYNWDGNADSVSVAVSQGVLLIVSIRHNGTTLKLRVNGGTEVSVASGNTQNITNALEIGRSNNGSARYQAMRIGEMILYNTSHSDGDRDLNEAYLTGRWA